MSTSVNTASLFPDWKQEINRRIAAHRSLRTPSPVKSRETEESHRIRDSRAALAAARVAQRYALAPSYSAMLANEARAAVRAAEAASKAAQDAQAAVQFMLEGLEAAATPEAAAITAAAPLEASEPILSESLLSDSVVSEDHPLFSPELQRVDSFGTPEELRGVDQPIYANLIQFPREMVATRRIRPRLAEGPLFAAPTQTQLSIFEVDPGSISTEAAPAIDEPAAPIWMRAEFAPIEVESLPEQDSLEEPIRQDQPLNRIQLAPLSRRMMALAVDAGLVLTVFVSVALQYVSHAKQMPGLRTAELGAVLSVLAISAIYQTLFYTLARSTPGMRYAGIALSTFDGLHPSRAQRCRRLTALLLSVLPLGLGLVWALFDDGSLSWHDRISRTYLRRR